LARPLPIVRAGTWYHVVNRGVNGSVLFPTPHEADAFVTVLGEVAERFAVEIHAYCAMGNHYHFLVRADADELLRAIGKVDAAIPGETGRARLRRMVFGRHLLHVTRYIHRNPVDAGLATRPADWAWSSYRGYLDRLEAPHWLQSRVILDCLGSIGARQRYRRYVEEDDRAPGPPGLLGV